MDAAAELRRLVYGYQVSQALHVASMLGLSDLLGEGPRSVPDLAAATGADERSLQRLLRALATVDVYRRTEDDRFANTALGDALRSDAPHSIAAWARFMGSDYYWEAERPDHILPEKLIRGEPVGVPAQVRAAQLQAHEGPPTAAVFVRSAPGLRTGPRCAR